MQKINYRKVRKNSDAGEGVEAQLGKGFNLPHSSDSQSCRNGANDFHGAKIIW